MWHNASGRGGHNKNLAWILKPRIKSFRKLGCHSPTAGSLIPKPVIVTEAGINLLLCLSVYLLLVNSKMPKTSTAFPLLTKFYGSAIIILVVAMCCTCLVYALYFMNSSGLELHHASVFLRLKVRDMCLKTSWSPTSRFWNLPTLYRTIFKIDLSEAFSTVLISCDISSLTRYRKMANNYGNFFGELRAHIRLVLVLPWWKWLEYVYPNTEHDSTEFAKLWRQRNTPKRAEKVRLGIQKMKSYLFGLCSVRFGSILGKFGRIEPKTLTVSLLHKKCAYNKSVTLCRGISGQKTRLLIGAMVVFHRLPLNSLGFSVNSPVPFVFLEDEKLTVREKKSSFPRLEDNDSDLCPSGGLPQQLALNSHIIFFSYYILVFTQNLTERETFGRL